jgi:3-dehydroquinate synthase
MTNTSTKPKIFFDTNELISYIKKENPSYLAIISSKNIFSKQRWIFDRITKTGFKSKIIFIKDGEQAKSFEQLKYVLDRFSQLSLDKKSMVLCIGGGSIGDLSGFAASIYLRGIDFINIPTTLLSQVDSAHGGKNGINFQNFKNQVGTIYEPKVIYIDTKFLKTLKRDQVVDGLGEIIKYGFIKDTSILSDLNNFHKNIQKIIKKSIACKYFYTNKDLHESSIRKILNIGHTFGHTIELKYALSHGKAVIIGMLKEFEFSEKIGLSEAGLKDKFIDTLNKLSIHINVEEYHIDMKALTHDKKVSGSSIAFPFVKKPGQSSVKKIYLHTIQKYLNE